MALVTVQRSPSSSSPCPLPCPSPSPSPELGAADDLRSRRDQLQRRQSFAVLRGAALGLQDAGILGAQEEDEPRAGTQEPGQPERDEEQKRHLCLMVELLRPQDDIRLAVQLESARPPRLRYLLVVSPSQLEARDETVLLGVDFPKGSASSCSLGLALPLWSDSQVYLDGDGGFSVTSGGQSRIFKPISIQTMWATLQVLHQVCEAALAGGLVPGSGGALAWTKYYQARVTSNQSCLNEWMAMADLESLRADPDPGRVSELELMERRIREELQHVLDTSDLDSITAKEIRQALEQRLGCPLQDHRDFIDNEALLLLAQRDRASRIFPHVYLGSEWNAANLEELQRNGVSHILNMSREIDNFFPELFTYHNVRLWDEESSQLLPHWPETHRFIETARAQGSHVLVHCKMGVSRSAATVVAYAMKQYGWELDVALRHVKDLRPVTHPIPSFLRQLHTYQGILTASRQSQVWEQKAGGSSLEELAAQVPSQLPPPTPSDPGDSGAPAGAAEESGPAGRRRRIDLRRMMRSISCLESPELKPMTPGDLPEVFSAEEGAPQPSQEEIGRMGPSAFRPALESHQSVMALQSAALVASRSRVFEGQQPLPSIPRARRMVRQASVDENSGDDQGRDHGDTS